MGRAMRDELARPLSFACDARNAFRNLLPPPAHTGAASTVLSTPSIAPRWAARLPATPMATRRFGSTQAARCMPLNPAIPSAGHPATAAATAAPMRPPARASARRLTTRVLSQALKGARAGY